jgi:phosphoglycerate dehydrogenase-like enzyme
MTETVLITSYLEPELVEAIRAGWAGEVLYQPGLLPRPRYVADHGGDKPELDPAGEERWRALLARAEICFDFDWWQPGRLLENAPRLRWVQATSAGIGAFMQRTGLDRSGLTATTAGGIHAVPLAEFAVMGALHFVKGVPDLRRRQQARNWERYTTRQLAGQRALVVGLGGVGRRVVASFAALGVEVWGLGRDARSYEVDGLSKVITRQDLDAALPSVDIVVLACPLTEETEGLLGRRQLGLLPPGAVLVNVARGQIVDQQALIDGLRSGRLGGACLDVFATEPLPADSPLWDMDNVIVSPHSASTVATENEALTDLFIDNLERFADNRLLRNRYEPADGY